MTEPPTPPTTTAELLLARLGDAHPGLLFEDDSWTWDEFVHECIDRAHFLLSLHRPDRPFHIGVMLENTPEYLFLIGGAALCGATVVGVNLTRRGAELAADIRFTDCDVLITDSTLVHNVDGLDHGVDPERVFVIDTPEYAEGIKNHHHDSPPDVAAARDPRTQLLLLFTSGSTGAPKAVICSTGRFALIAGVKHMGLGRDDISYNSMPLFHGNALMACWANPLLTGGTFALARKFTASGFLGDITKFRATYFNYVGRSLAYILAQPEKPAERHTSLRHAFGTEASEQDRAEFERRFGVTPTENYGSSEGGLAINRTPDSPPSALGLPAPGIRAAVLDPETLKECPRAEFDEQGRLLNAEAAIGELANLDGAAAFEGYYKNPEATAERVRGNIFLTGDLGYRDSEGFFYFAGRGGDRIRVDSENFSAAPIERILSRYPSLQIAVVYPVPDERTGDQVMATLQMEDPAGFDPDDFGRFLSVQPDLGTKWAPRYVRVTGSVPVTATRKVNKPLLRREAWEVNDLVYVRTGSTFAYEPLTAEGQEELRSRFQANSRGHLLQKTPKGSGGQPIDVAQAVTKVIESGATRSAVARDAVNIPMINHLCDALTDNNPVYSDTTAARDAGHPGVVAPPTALQVWTMTNPREEADPNDVERVYNLLRESGFPNVVAVNCDQIYDRYLTVGDVITSREQVESITGPKKTALGTGYFLTTKTVYTDQRGEQVGTMLFRTLWYAQHKETA